MSEFIDLQDELIQRCIKHLLKDKTTKKNIVFATDSYKELGAEYQADHEITESLLASLDLKPRILKSQEEQAFRTKNKAEVFSPAWLCCKMNNHCDDEWFGSADIFNYLEGENWMPTRTPVSFPEGKSWKKYVDSRRLELTCGEAPFIISRYDAATGDMIKLSNRVGILDRKLRVVNENTETYDDWFNWTKRAFQSVYGYEWQGDSLLIARINLLLTFVDYYRARWGNNPSESVIMPKILQIANVIAWNFWQMDGLTGKIPYGDPENIQEEPKQMSLFDMGFEFLKPIDIEDMKRPTQMMSCRIFDWRANKSLLYNSLKKG